MNPAKICDRIIEFTFYLLFLLVPLILTPWNSELFEFNKILVVYISTIIIVSAWFIKTIVGKKIIFQHTFWDIPLIVFLLTQLTSYLFSIDHHTSFWGYYSRFNGGLLSLICYSLLYWSFVSNLEKRSLRLTINCLLFTGTIVAFYGILEHFGIDDQIWVQDVKNRVFSTLGQPNWLAAYLVALIPLTWSLTLKRKLFNRYYLIFIILYVCLLFTKSRSGLLGFGVAFVIFWLFNFRRYFRQFLFLTISSLLLAIITGFPVNLKQPDQPSINHQIATNQPLIISESSDIRKVVWKGAFQIWKQHPVLGTGPETFAYSYYWYRPGEHNNLSEWDFLYNKAHNEYLNYAATTGSIGLVAYILLIGSVLIYLIKISKSNFLNPALISGFGSILVTNFFGFSVVPVQLLFFLLPAFAVITGNDQLTTNKPLNKRLSNTQKLLVISVMLLTCYLLRVIVNYWRADFHYARGEKLNQSGEYDLAFNQLQKAIKLRSFEPAYHDELAYAAANLASNNTLIKIAIDETNKAVSANPFSLVFWKNQTKVYYRLAEIDPQYYFNALNSLRQAADLAPTDAKVRYNLALIYAAVDQLDPAIENLKQAINLKPNYEEAYYALGSFYEEKKDLVNARTQYQYLLEHLNPNNLKAKEKLEKL